MNKTSLRRSLAVGASALAAFAFAAPAYAGEDDDDDEDTPAAVQPAPESNSGGGGGGGGSDSKSARGGVQTGFGGALATTADDDSMVPLALIGGGVLMLTASGLAFRRRAEQDAV